MKRIYALLTLVSIVCLLLSITVSDSIISVFVEKSPYTFVKVKDIYTNGKDSIQSLIAFIDMSSMRYLPLKNPRTEIIFPENTSDFSGVGAAYLIELILARSSLEEYKQYTEEDNSLFGFNSTNYIFPAGIIRKNAVAGEKGLGGERLICSDLPKIQELYRKWMRNVSDKTVEEMRTIWMTKKPLDGSIYYWR